jgi:hypothetical protein
MVSFIQSCYPSMIFQCYIYFSDLEDSLDSLLEDAGPEGTGSEDGKCLMNFNLGNLLHLVFCLFLNSDNCDNAM